MKTRNEDLTSEEKLERYERIVEQRRQYGRKYRDKVKKVSSIVDRLIKEGKMDKEGNLIE